MLNIEQKARVKWSCRRGMLELDVMLMPFFEQCFAGLTASEQQDFIDLLAYNDFELFIWFMGQGRCELENIATMVDKIVTYNHSQQG